MSVNNVRGLSTLLQQLQCHCLLQRQTELTKIIVCQAQHYRRGNLSRLPRHRRKCFCSSNILLGGRHVTKSNSCECWICSIAGAIGVFVGCGQVWLQNCNWRIFDVEFRNVNPLAEELVDNLLHLLAHDGVDGWALV